MIDMDAAVRAISDMQAATTTKDTDAWYACNRAIHVLWKLGDAASTATHETEESPRPCRR